MEAGGMQGALQKLSSVRRLESEPIAEPVDRSEVDRTDWIILQLLTEFHNVIIDRTCGGISTFVAPNFVQQLCARDDAIRVLKEKPQSLEFTGS
jgi:hypothetical protein